MFSPLSPTHSLSRACAWGTRPPLGAGAIDPIPKPRRLHMTPLPGGLNTVPRRARMARRPDGPNLAPRCPRSLPHLGGPSPRPRCPCDPHAPVSRRPPRTGGPSPAPPCPGPSPLSLQATAPASSLSLPATASAASSRAPTLARRPRWPWIRPCRPRLPSTPFPARRPRRHGLVHLGP